MASALSPGGRDGPVATRVGIADPQHAQLRAPPAPGGNANFPHPEMNEASSRKESQPLKLSDSTDQHEVSDSSYQ